MFTLTKDGNLSKDGKETKPEMTVQEFKDAFNVSEEGVRIGGEGRVWEYTTKDYFGDIPCKFVFTFVDKIIMNIQLIISTEPFLDKCGDDEDIQDIQREECLKLIEKNVKYREKDTDGKMHVMYFCKDARVSLLQEVMQAELIIIVRYVG